MLISFIENRIFVKFYKIIDTTKGEIGKNSKMLG